MARPTATKTRPAADAPRGMPGWPPPERLAVIIEEIRKGIELYRAKFEARDDDKGQQP